MALIQPAIPILDYLINYDYIVKQLCENRDKPVLACNGKCYLGGQVKLQLDLDQNQEKPTPPEVDLEKFITLKGSFNTEFNTIEVKMVNKTYFSNSLFGRNFGKTPLRPPIV